MRSLLSVTSVIKMVVSASNFRSDFKTFNILHLPAYIVSKIFGLCPEKIWLASHVIKCTKFNSILEQSLIERITDAKIRPHDIKTKPIEKKLLNNILYETSRLAIKQNIMTKGKRNQFNEAATNASLNSQVWLEHGRFSLLDVIIAYWKEMCSEIGSNTTNTGDLLKVQLYTTLYYSKKTCGCIRGNIQLTIRLTIEFAVFY